MIGLIIRVQILDNKGYKIGEEVNMIRPLVIISMQ